MAWDDEDDFVSVLVPVDVLNTAGALVSITAGGVALPEDTNPAWASGTTYTTGQRVYSASTHRVYESLKDSNTGKDPTLIANRVSAAGVGTWWFDVGPTNLAAVFDGLTSSQTVAASPLEITIAPGAFNGFALFGIDADTMSVEVLDAPGGNVIYSETGTILEGSMPADYYEYLFDRFKPLTQLVRTGIEPYSNPRIKLTLTKAAGPVKLGMFAMGDLRPLGIPQRGATVEPQDFSYFKQDAYGNATLQKRGNATGMSIDAVMNIEDAGAVLDTVQELLGTPVVVVGSEAEMYEWMTVFGLISGKMSADPFPYVTLSMTVRGLL